MTLVLFEILLKSECVDQFMGVMEVELPNTRAYDGCQHVTPFLHQDGRTCVLVEYWESRQHFEKYLEWRAAPGPGYASLGDLANLIEGDPTIRYFEALET